MIVFSSPAAKIRSGNCGVVMSLRARLSQTPWCRWMTLTGGTVPSARTRLGAIRTIQPSCGGLGTAAPLNSMAFCPGWIWIGPYFSW